MSSQYFQPEEDYFDTVRQAEETIKWILEDIDQVGPFNHFIQTYYREMQPAIPYIPILSVFKEWFMSTALGKLSYGTKYLEDAICSLPEQFEAWEKIQSIKNFICATEQQKLFGQFLLACYPRPISMELTEDSLCSLFLWNYATCLDTLLGEFKEWKKARFALFSAACAA
jgi:hypothetical protein